MFCVLVWDCNWILFMHGFCPIHQIQLIVQKSLHFEKTRVITLFWTSGDVSPWFHSLARMDPLLVYFLTNMQWAYLDFVFCLHFSQVGVPSLFSLFWTTEIPLPFNVFVSCWMTLGFDIFESNTPYSFVTGFKIQLALKCKKTIYQKIKSHYSSVEFLHWLTFISIHYGLAVEHWFAMVRFSLSWQPLICYSFFCSQRLK